MASFFVDLWESIFTPGPTPSILRATNVTFAALQFVLAALLLATWSLHFVILSVLCGSLWWSINWFAAEVAIAQEQQQQMERSLAEEEKDKGNEEELRDEHKPRRKPAASAADESSDTEVEGSTAVAGAPADLRQRPAATSAGRAPKLSSDGRQSSVSTEDEWEKVSGSEREKGK
ncbi:hypothetical protein DCS_07546 [Drechmeria coniospora]|uniref:Endoplasmic reticulum, protein Pkr1 n=1 Tax=Drechmeria coniospora TaxID=98403 RepID=A0A151GES8_DRECN|nr:hypothetical protein DCS_07546 [Drechmeria coniospora]KYK55583.1 hypothetical protein DCS_07546 [Drechmeria coniospora]ODA81809.1 hypothetical protein RJ55_00313 [Drechmeria coniospora]